MILNVKSVSKKFGHRLVLDEVDLHCPAGAITALVGPNGAGKTTLFKIMLGLLQPDSGEVQPLDSSAVGGIVEKPALYPYLSAAENIQVFTRSRGKRFSRSQVSDYLQQVGLSAKRDDPVRNYSMGMKQRLGIAIALLNDPAALILDEPFTGLDPMGIKDLSDLLRQLAHEQGLAILVSSHFIDQLVRFCDHLHLIREGKIVAGDQTDRLVQRLTTAYRIVAADLERSSTLKRLKINASGSLAVVPATLIDPETLLRELTAEGIYPTSLNPELDLDHIGRS